jgi:nucleotide-binding universal stress UspA family protein
MYERLLLPTDLSAGVDRAIEYAIDTAGQYDAELHILYVVDAEAYSSYPGDEYVHEAARPSRISPKPPQRQASTPRRSSATASPTRRFSTTWTGPIST